MDSNCDSIGKKPCDDEELGHVTKNLSEPMPQQAVTYIHTKKESRRVNDLFPFFKKLYLNVNDSNLFVRIECIF